MEQLYRHYYRQQFLVGGTVTALSVAKGFGGICDYPFDNSSSFVLLLLQQGTYQYVAGIGAEDKVLFSGRYASTGADTKVALRVLKAPSQASSHTKSTPCRRRLVIGSATVEKPGIYRR